MQAADFVGVEFELNFVPIGQMNVGVVALVFSDVGDFIYKRNGGFEIWKFEIVN